jgi:hypothetical protein
MVIEVVTILILILPNSELLLLIGAAVLALILGPRFLQFDASIVLYPPLIMVCIALGAAQIASAIFK